jgi:small basic protein
MISVIFAVGGVAFYALYSRVYDPLCDNSKNTSLSALLLYGYAAVLLAIGTILTALIEHDAWTNFKLPETTKLWAYNLNISKDSFTDIMLSLLIMVTCYALSIILESRSRKELSIATFDIAYQVNAVVVIVLSSLLKFNTNEITKSEIIGCITVLIGSVLPLFFHYFTDNNFSKRISVYTILSGIFCGIALTTDANLTKQIIFFPEFSWQSTSIFLAYEGFTFFAPFIIALLYFLVRFGKNTIIIRHREEKIKQKKYWEAAFYSAIYFVCSVFAYYIDKTMLVPAIFAASALIVVKYDPVDRHIDQRKMEYFAAFLVLLGLLIISYHQFLT